MSASLGDLIVSLGIDTSGLTTGASSIENALESIGTRLFFLGSRIGAAFSVPLAGAVAAIATFGGAFDSAMTESLAIMDNVTPQIKARMEEQARAVSETTKFSSTEAAKAYYSLASAGLTAVESINALPLVAKFAQAGVMDLAHAADDLAGAQTALGLKTGNAAQDMQNMTRISDVLVKVNNIAIGTVKDYSTALSTNAANAMRVYGVSLEEGVAVLGAFGREHILGQRAGQLLYMTLRDLTTAAIKHKDAFAEAGIKVFDANGNMRSMADITDDLTKKFGGMTAEGRRAEMGILGLTSRSQQGINALIGMGDQIRNMTGELRNAGGTTEEVAQKQMASFVNQMAQMAHKFENVAIQIFNSFRPAFETYVIPLMNRALEMARDFANYLDTLSTSTKGWALALVGLGIALGPVLVGLGGLFMMAKLGATMVGLAEGIAAIGGAVEVMAEATAATTGATAAATTAATTMTTVGLAPWIAAVGFWGGIIIVIGGVVYALKEMAGGWGALADILNGLTGGVLYALGNGLMTVYHGVVNNIGILGDLYQIVKFVAYAGIDYLSEKLHELAEWGGKVKIQWGDLISLLNPATMLFTVIKDSIVGLNGALRDHLPFLASMEDWLSNKLSAAVDKFKEKYRQFMEYIRASNAAHGGGGGKDVELPKDEPMGPMTPAWITEMNDKLGKLGADNGPVAQATARMKNLMDEISGKKTLADAQLWATAIENLGGASQVAEKDINTAVKVFDDAIDRLEKMGKGGSAAAERYLYLRDSLFYASKEGEKLYALLDKIEQKGKTTQQLGPSMFPGYVPMTAEGTDAGKVLKELNNVQLGGKTTSQLTPQMFPGFTPTSSIMASTKDFLLSTKLTYDALGTVSAQFKEFARIAGKDSGLGQAMTNVGDIFETLARAQKAAGQAKGGPAGNFGYGSVLFDSKATGGQRISAGVNAAGAIVQGASDVWSATEDHESAGGNALGGAMAGAKAGAAFGPYGIAIGAAAGLVVGLIRGKPEWAKAADEVGRDFGVKIDRALGDEIAKLAKSDFGGSRQAAEIAEMSKIIDQAGGLNAKNLGQMEARFHDVFSMIETHQMTIAQGAKVLDENWDAFAKAGTDSLGFLDDKLQEIIRLNDKFGTQSKSITEYLKSQSGRVAEGFNAIAAGADTTQTSFDRMGRLASVAFGSALASGKSFTEALSAIGDGLDTAEAEAKKFGFTQTEAFGQLISIRDFTKANGDLIGELEGVNKMVTGLVNTNRMNKETFTDLGTEATSVYDRMIAKGLNSNAAMILMQPTLQTLWEAQHKFGFETDEATQKLLDQAEADGIVGEEHKSTSDQMLDQLSKLNKTMSDFVDLLTGHTIPALTNVGTAGTTAINNVHNALNNTPWQRWADEGVDAANRVEREVDHVTFGRSPTGVRGLVTMLDTARITGLKTTDHLIDSFGNVEGALIDNIKVASDFSSKLTNITDIAPKSLDSRAVGAMNTGITGIGRPSAGGSGSQRIEVVVQVDGREIARKALEYIPEELRRNGIFT